MKTLQVKRLRRGQFCGEQDNVLFWWDYACLESSEVGQDDTEKRVQDLELSRFGAQLCLLCNVTCNINLNLN